MRLRLNRFATRRSRRSASSPTRSSNSSRTLSSYTAPARRSEVTARIVTSDHDLILYQILADHAPSTLEGFGDREVRGLNFGSGNAVRLQRSDHPCRLVVVLAKGIGNRPALGCHADAERDAIGRKLCVSGSAHGDGPLRRQR